MPCVDNLMYMETDVNEFLDDEDNTSAVVLRLDGKWASCWNLTDFLSIQNSNQFYACKNYLPQFTDEDEDEVLRKKADWIKASIHLKGKYSLLHVGSSKVALSSRGMDRIKTMLAKFIKQATAHKAYVINLTTSGRQLPHIISKSAYDNVINRSEFGQGTQVCQYGESVPVVEITDSYVYDPSSGKETNTVPDRGG